MSETSFIPGPATTRALRDALGRFPTGVTVVTAQGADGPEGMTANSFASVSLDPALVLWCPAKTSRRHDLFTTTDHFGIHVLSEAQEDIALAFARPDLGFGEIAPDLSPEGIPLLPRALARFDCATYAVHDAGDHSIVIGRILRATHAPGQALLFHDGAFGITSGT